MKYYVLPYCLKVWATGVLLAPVIILLISINYFLKPGDSLDLLSVIGLLFRIYLALIIIGAVLSLVTFIVFWIIGIMVYYSIANRAHQKLVMALIGGILTACTFFFLFLLLFDEVFNGFAVIIIPCYCFCISASSLIYDLG
jgi:hypothetical protein